MTPPSLRSATARGDPLPLRQGAAVGLLAAACLAVRAGAAACRACEGACPVRALAVDGDGPRLVADCRQCGRCAAICPSGALRVEGFIGSDLPAGDGGPVEVECARAPARLAASAIRVPCLGGVTPARLLRWWLAAGDRGLTFVNRGGCEDCLLGGAAFAAEGALQQASAWLLEAGVAADGLPLSRRAPGGLRPLSAVLQDMDQARRALSRRGFFRRLTTQVGQAAPIAAPPSGPRALLQREPCALPAREELLDVLRLVGQGQGRSLPASVVPALTLDAGRCADHGPCAGVCPTGALRRVEEAGASALHVDSGRCVSCRRCVQACPAQALALGDSGSLGVVTLRSRAMRECIECGAGFAADRSGALCARCSTGAGLARSIFGTRIAET